jgi:hypothetical protein
MEINVIYVDSFRYVKRALPIDDEHPRERFETATDLMIVTDVQSQKFLNGVQAYFSYYGKIYDCEYRQERNFDYLYIRFGDIGNQKMVRIVSNRYSLFRSS